MARFEPGSSGGGSSHSANCENSFGRNLGHYTLPILSLNLLMSNVYVGTYCLKTVALPIYHWLLYKPALRLS